MPLCFGIIYNSLEAIYRENMEDFIRTYTIDENICDGLVSFFEDNNDWTNPGRVVKGVDKTVKDSTDLSVSIYDYDERIIEYRRELNDCKNKYMEDFLKEGFPDKNRLSPQFNIQRYPPLGGFKVWHSERGSYTTMQRCLVFMTYLNTVEVGGETEWFYQKVKVKPIKGLTVLWPSDFTHTHRGCPALHETKMIATGWFELRG